MRFEITRMLEKLTIIHQNKSTNLKLICSNVAVMPGFMLVLFHILMEAYNKTVFFHLNQLHQPLFYSAGICHLC